MRFIEGIVVLKFKFFDFLGSSLPRVCFNFFITLNLSFIQIQLLYHKFAIKFKNKRKQQNQSTRPQIIYSLNEQKQIIITQHPKIINKIIPNKKTGQMQNSQIIKKRLNDLKKLSQNLKQSTQIKSDIDINLIKAIFDITKNTSSSMEMSMSYTESKRLLSRQESGQISQKSSRLQKIQSQQLFAKFLGKSQSVPQNMQLMNNSAYYQESQNIDKLFPDSESNSPLSKSTSKWKLKFSKKQSGIPGPRETVIEKSNEEQIVFLREQNMRLEKQIKQLRNVLYKVRDEDQKQRSQRNQNLNQFKKIRDSQVFDQFGEESYEEDANCPFFRINQQVDTFVTKLSINTQDYHKIQYTEQTLKLTLDKLLIKRPQSSRIPSTSSNRHLKQSQKSPTSSPNITKLSLINLKQVNYIDNNVMFLTFIEQRQNEQENAQKIHVYLKFDEEESLHRWDLSIYTNFCIIDNLGISKVFLKNKFNQRYVKVKIQEKQLERKEDQEEREEDFEKLEDRELLMKYLQNKQKFIQSQKKLRSVMLQKINIKKKQSLQSQNFEGSLELMRSDSKKFNKSNKNYESGSIQKLALLQQQQFQSRQNEMEAKLRAQKKQKQQKISREQQEKRLQLQRLQQRMKMQEQNRQKQKMRKQQQLKFLKQGIFVTKYAKSALKPHQKKLFLSKDNQKLCWIDKQKSQKQPKFVQISQIESINQGEVGEGVKSHIDQKKIKNLKCFLLIKTQDKDRKIIEFSSKSLKEMEYFCQALIGFVGDAKRNSG